MMDRSRQFRHSMYAAMKDYLPDWAHPWLDVITLGL
jgi:hypothetical protein